MSYGTCFTSVCDVTDGTKQISFVMSTLPTNTKTTIQFSQTANRTITISDAGANSNLVQDTGGALTITNAAIVGGALIGTGSTTASWQTTTAFTPSHANFYTISAVSINTTSNVNFTTGDSSNTSDITNSSGVITVGTAGTYWVHYGVWNTTNTSQSYVATVNGTSTTLAKSVVSAQDQLSMTTMSFIHTFSANDTIRIVGTGAITNSVPSVTTPVALTASINFTRIA